MRTLITALALSAAAFTAVPAMADDDDKACGSAPQSEWMAVDAVKAKFEGQGYSVRKVEIDDGCYEVYAIDKAGMKVETYVNPVTAEVVKTKIDD